MLLSILHETFHKEYNQLPSTNIHALIRSHMPEQQNIRKYYLENDHSYSQSIYSSFFKVKRFIRIMCVSSLCLSRFSKQTNKNKTTTDVKATEEREPEPSACLAARS